MVEYTINQSSDKALSEEQNRWEAIIRININHNERDGVSSHQPHYCLLNRVLKRRSKKISKLCVTGLCEGNSPVTGEVPAQRASSAENVSIWWLHHECRMIDLIHESQNAPVPCPTMLHSEQKCAHFCPEWGIVGCGTGAFWDLWNWSIMLYLCHAVVNKEDVFGWLNAS